MKKADTPTDAELEKDEAKQGRTVHEFQPSWSFPHNELTLVGTFIFVEGLQVYINHC